MSIVMHRALDMEVAWVNGWFGVRHGWKGMDVDGWEWIDVVGDSWADWLGFFVGWVWDTGIPPMLWALVWWNMHIQWRTVITQSCWWQIFIKDNRAMGWLCGFSLCLIFCLSCCNDVCNILLYWASSQRHSTEHQSSLAEIMFYIF